MPRHLTFTHNNTTYKGLQEVSNETGIPTWRIQKLVTQNVIQPGMLGSGQGTGRRMFTEQNIQELILVTTLLDDGLILWKAKEALEQFRMGSRVIQFERNGEPYYTLQVDRLFEEGSCSKTE